MLSYTCIVVHGIEVDNVYCVLSSTYVAVLSSTLCTV